MTAAGDGRAGHGEMGEELRLLALTLLDRYEPRVRSVLAGLRVEAAEAADARQAAEPEPAAGPQVTGGEQPAACQWCPVCSLIAVLRGDQPELGGRIAEHGDALLSTLRAVLDRPPHDSHQVDGWC